MAAVSTIGEWIGILADQPVEVRTLFGFPLLDALSDGMIRGCITVVGGRPGEGKSAFCLQVALAAAYRGERVLFLSLEMTPRQLIGRALSAVSGEPAWRIRRGEVDVLPVQEQLADLPLHLGFVPGMFQDEIRQHLDAMPDKPTLVVVDYLQLVRGTLTGAGNRQMEVSETVRTMQAVALEYGVTLLAASQLNRQIAFRSADARCPVLTDLRDSGEIEQAARQVVLLHPGDAQGESRNVTLILAKNNEGRVGTVDMTFHGPTTTFSEASHVL